MFYLAGIIITFFLAILLAGKKGKTAADKILTIWLIIIGFHLTAFYLYVAGKYLHFPWLLGIELPLPLIHGPFLFLYTTALTQSRKIKAIGLLHFLPLIICYLVMQPFFQLSNEEKINVYKRSGAGYEWLTDSVFIAIIMSGIIYVTLSFLKLRQHKVNIENQFSNTAKINLNWLRYLIFGTMAIWIVIITGLNDTYIFSTVVLYVFFMGYFGIRQVGIFSNVPVDDSEPKIKTTGNSGGENLESEIVETAKPIARSKYQKSSLTNEDALAIHQHLQKLMNNNKVFKDPELNLGELAGKLSVHPNVLSQVINSFEQKTFYDYINGLRIEEFKSLVANPANSQYTLLSLAFDCGFNSKTAFNRNFKKSTGLSPSEYLNQLKIKLA